MSNLAERVLLVDNYDSFTYNLLQLIWVAAGEEPIVRRNDAVGADEVAEARPRAVIISPGPGRPEDAGASEAIIQTCRDGGIPLLGVCLGHQALGRVYGARVVHGPEPVHGKVHPIEHQGRRILKGIPTPFQATRYHSLVVEAASLPEELEVLARTSDGIIMALADRTRPLYGLQFHPESVATPEGHRMVRTFLEEANVPS